MAERALLCNELRLVLLGGFQAGKSSVAHTFLNVKCEKGQMTTQCVKMEGNINGRRIIVVDTPGWWKCNQMCDTPQRLKAELIRSLSFCPPGPHVCLLVIDVEFAFAETHRKATEDHMKFIAEKIWNHTIIVFTKLKYLGEKNIEQYIEGEGESMNKLIKKCDNRYVGFDSDLDTDGSQGKELLRQIETLVTENNSHYFEVDATKMTFLEKEKELEKKATARQRMVLEKRGKLEEIKNAGAGHDSSPLNIVLLGWVLSGKTLAGSVILGTESLVDKTVKTSGEVNGRKITVLDTPSWWKYLPYQLNADSVKTEILKAMTYSPHAVLLVIPADTAFLEAQLEVTLENMRPLGENIWRQTMVLFTWGGTLGDKSIEYHIESEGDTLVRLIEMCGNRYHMFESMRDDDKTQVSQLLEKIDDMILENTLLNSDDEHQRKKKRFQENETLSEWLRLEDVKKLLCEEWERSDAMMNEMFKSMSPHVAVRRGWSAVLPPTFSGEEIKTGLFVNKNQLKDVLEKEWNRREAIHSSRIQYKQTCLDACTEMSSCADEKDIQISLAKVQNWYQKHYSSDYGSVSSYEEKNS